MSEAACAVDVAAIRAEASDGAEQVSQALRGEPLRVVERREGWARVRTAYGYPGWVREGVLGPIAEGEWLQGTERDPLTAARAYLGAPYEWGGMTTRGIDCSGLVHMAYRRSGKLIPRDAWQQEEAGAPVPERDMRPGDLITYGAPDGAADHIAFWLGGGRILHATRRDAVDGVIEEVEPAHLRGRRRRIVRF